MIKLDFNFYNNMLKYTVQKSLHNASKFQYKGGVEKMLLEKRLNIEIHKEIENYEKNEIDYKNFQLHSQVSCLE